MHKYHYRAGERVTLGLPDEHAYNMFMSVLEMCHRLGLWQRILPWKNLHIAWQRIALPVYNEYLRKRREQETQVAVLET